MKYYILNSDPGYRDEYYKKTGRYPEMEVTNISSEKEFADYSKVIEKFDQLEIVDDAYDTIGNRLLPSMKAVVFKDKYDEAVVQRFWAEASKMLGFVFLSNRGK